ncbi:E3 ubiquitin-protein ligase TRIM71-like [Mytilus edulis]|uniref:E3 ubiquitin-protein ligase TRIM71-like n=1 Tax=Mytilus edulis TaxID=6550 RepID=UPI0039F12BE6
MAQAASKTCEICVSAPGSQYCLECEQYYCENCKSLHKRQKLSTNHQFQHASELIPEGKSRCSQHKEESNLMCNTCNVPVCTSCVTGNHNGHKFSKLVDVIAQLRGDNEKQIRDKTNEANQNITKIEVSLKSFDNDVESVIKAITDQSNNIKRMVDKSVSKMIALVKEQSTKEKDKLMKILSAAKSTLVVGQNLDRRRLDLDKARPDETMVQQINKMKEEINKLHIDSLPEFPKISFDSKAVTEDDIRQLIGSYTLSRCSPVKDKEYQQLGWLFRCSSCGNIPAAPAYGVYVSQIRHCSRVSSMYVDFVERGILLSQKLLRQGYESIKLRSSLKKVYGRHHELIGHHDKSETEIISDILPQS